MLELGSVKPVEVREIWPNEARDFTPWLAQNLDRLGEAVGLDFELTEKESCVGSFWCDLVATGIGNDKVIVIENQLESANHGHLGQLLTYAAGKEASVVIWVAKDIRDEYKQALVWLNSRTDTKTDFFGVVVEAFRVDDSKPAVKFNVVVAPNEWRKLAAESTRVNDSPKNEKYRQFFQTLLDELRDKHKFTNSKSPRPRSWMFFSSGIAGVVYGASFSQGDRVRVDLYIEFPDAELNNVYFNVLLGKREEIETALGETLEWEPLPIKKACRIAVYRSGSIESNEQELSEIQTWIARKLLAFKKVFTPLLDPTRRTAQDMLAGQKETEDQEEDETGV